MGAESADCGVVRAREEDAPDSGRRRGAQSCEPAVERVRERLTIAYPEHRGTACDRAAVAELCHQIAHRESLFHVLGRIELTAWIERGAAFLDHSGCERDV